MVGRLDGARYELMRHALGLALLAAVMASSACSRSDARATTVAPSDTLHSSEESLRRFRHTLTPVESLAPVFKSKEDLARAYVAAILSSDMRGIAQTLMTRAEFAWVYYPENPLSRPPYELPAGLAWFELEGNSLAGVRRALATYGGRGVVLRELQCSLAPVEQRTNRLWNGCVAVLRHEDGSDAEVRMFGTILERGGRFKLVTAANDL